MKNLAQSIPAKVRSAIYVVLGIVLPIEAVWDVVPPALEGKVLATLAALGFAVAALNVPPKYDY